MRLEVRDAWDGTAGVDLAAAFTLQVRARGLHVRVEAPSRADPPPAAPPGRTAALWEHEVVELFLLGEDDRYLEVELGPHGHWLALALHGPRNVVDDAVRIAPSWSGGVDPDGRWNAEFTVRREDLPPALTRVNAYAIYGRAPRLHRAWRPVPGAAPDFHRLPAFGPLDSALVTSLRGA